MCEFVRRVGVFVLLMPSFLPQGDDSFWSYDIGASTKMN